jgi:hypothetical protein
LRVGGAMGWRVGIIKKYSFVLMLALAVGYAYAPPGLLDVVKLRWLDDINGIFNKSLTSARRDVGIPPVDPIAAGNVNEDLDYRIAQRTKSAEGWRSFLAVHPDGPHAQSARAELEKVIPKEESPAPAAALSSEVMVLDTKAPSEAASPAQPARSPEAAELADDEICRLDEDRLRWLSSSGTSD